jgi:hypothetical protein
VLLKLGSGGGASTHPPITLLNCSKETSGVTPAKPNRRMRLLDRFRFHTLTVEGPELSGIYSFMLSPKSLDDLKTLDEMTYSAFRRSP